MSPTLLLLASAVLSSAPPSAAWRAPLPPAADTAPSIRWHRLAWQLHEDAAALRRAAREAAERGDSSALRRLQPLPAPLRLFALLGVAQQEAGSAARRDTHGGPSPRAAVAAASATILERLLPDPASDSVIARERARDFALSWHEAGGEARVRTGARLGEEVAERLLAWASDDHTEAIWTGTVPTGPGMWWSTPGATPGGAAWPSWRPWTLASVDQFRPPPPPAYGSPEFEVALDEVRRVARERTPEQTRIARHWVKHPGLGAWSEIATDLLVKHGAPEEQAERALALLGVAAYDATLACWEAKYHYWLLRPTQADSTITFPEGMGLPNFPAYPSGHACGAGAVATVLGEVLPRERAELTRLADEAAMSRLYAGVHYRFDNDVGLELGRAVGRHVLERERRSGLVPWRR